MLQVPRYAIPIFGENPPVHRHSVVGIPHTSDAVVVFVFPGGCNDGEGTRDVSQVGDRGTCRANSTKLYLPARGDEKTDANARTYRRTSGSE